MRRGGIRVDSLLLGLRFPVPPMVSGTLIACTLLDTVLSGHHRHVPPPAFQESHAPRIDVAVQEGD